MTARVKMGHDNGAADTPYATVSYGPLLFALAIPDTTDANTPDAAAKWNYALDVHGESPGYDVTVERRPMPKKWGWQLDAPLRLHVQARSFDWKPATRRALPNEPVGKRRGVAVSAGDDHDASAGQSGRERSGRRGNQPDSLRLHEVPRFDVSDHRTGVQVARFAEGAASGKKNSGGRRSRFSRAAIPEKGGMGNEMTDLSKRLTCDASPLAPLPKRERGRLLERAFA